MKANIREFLQGLKNKRPKTYSKLARFAEQVKANGVSPTLTDNVLLQDGNTDLSLSNNPPKEWEVNPSENKLRWVVISSLLFRYNKSFQVYTYPHGSWWVSILSFWCQSGQGFPSRHLHPFQKKPTGQSGQPVENTLKDLSIASIGYQTSPHNGP